MSQHIAHQIRIHKDHKQVQNSLCTRVTRPNLRAQELRQLTVQCKQDTFVCLRSKQLPRSHVQKESNKCNFGLFFYTVSWFNTSSPALERLFLIFFGDAQNIKRSAPNRLRDYGQPGHFVGLLQATLWACRSYLGISWVLFVGSPHCSNPASCSRRG